MCAILRPLPKQEKQRRRNDATGQGFNVLNVSGNWDNGARAGAFLFDANNASQGVDFCGYRTWSTHILPRKRNIKAAKKRFQRLSRKFRRGEIRVEDARQSVASFLGYCKHCNAYVTVQATLNRLVLTRTPKKEEEKQHGKNSTHHDDHGKSD